jgi:hypothetical protein
MKTFSPGNGWNRSSRCGTESACVEVAYLQEDVAIRDSKLPDSSPYLTFSRDAWDAFIEDVKAGRHDRP